MSQVIALHSARLACEQSSYPAIIKRAIAIGHDTDTTACVAGGIAGLRYGLAGIPSDWLERLRGQELLCELGILERTFTGQSLTTNKNQDTRCLPKT